MKRSDPRTMSDEALTVALAIAQAVRDHDGRLGARMAVAELELEQLERMYARPSRERAA